MNILPNFDKEAIFGAACLIIMTIIFIKGMNTRPGGAGGSNKSNKSNNSSNSAQSNDNNNQ